MHHQHPLLRLKRRGKACWALMWRSQPHEACHLQPMLPCQPTCSSPRELMKTLCGTYRLLGQTGYSET